MAQFFVILKPHGAWTTLHVSKIGLILYLYSKVKLIEFS